MTLGLLYGAVIRTVVRMSFVRSHHFRRFLSDFYLFNGEVINKMVIVFIQAAMKGDTVTVKQQVL